MKFEKEELKNFLWDYSKFEYICNKICKELSRYEKFWSFMYKFSIEDKFVMCEGDESWPYGGYEEYKDKFDIDMLTWSDKELKDYVDKLISIRDEENKHKQELKEKEQRQKELKELERLKAKYGK